MHKEVIEIPIAIIQRVATAGIVSIKRRREESVSEAKKDANRSDMGRRKLKLQWIIDDAARKSTYQKRAKNLLKKAMEINTLCGVDTCAIVYSPYDPQPMVWPAPSDADKVIMEFKGRPDDDHIKKMYNQDNFTRQSLNKVSAKILKQQKKNDAMAMDEFIVRLLDGRNELQGLNLHQIADLAMSIDKQLRVIDQRRESLLNPAPQSGGSGDAAAPPAEFLMAQSSNSPAGVSMGQPRISTAAPPGASMAEMIPLDQREIIMNMLPPQQPMNMLPPQPLYIEGTSANPGGQHFTFPSTDYHYEEPSFWESSYNFR